jgi:hypothetical protein
VQGVDDLKRALKKYAPDLRDEMDATIKAELTAVRDAARAKVPGNPPGGLYNWARPKSTEEVSSRTSKSRGFPIYNSAVVRRGLVYRTGTQRFNPQGFATLFSLWNSSDVGAIIEVAGRKNRYGRPQMGNRGSKSTQSFGRSNNPDAGRRFVGALNGVGAIKSYDQNPKHRGRLLYAVYADRDGKTLDSVFKAIELAKRKFEARTQLPTSKAA